MKKHFAFPVHYGTFNETLVTSPLGLKIKLAHKKTITGVVLLNEKNIIGNFPIEIGIIVGKTPSTYYSGNRMYGKYIFIVPEGVIVKCTDYSGSSNDEAFENNESLLKVWPHSASSIGFDFYIIGTYTSGDQLYEVAYKATSIEFKGFADLDEEIFIKEAMSYNLDELIPNFSIFAQTQGWKRNVTETHLHAITKIKDVHCFIPFATPTVEIQKIDGVESLYIKQIVAKEDESIDETES